jgi:hypothetical protein
MPIAVALAAAGSAVSALGTGCGGSVGNDNGHTGVGDAAASSQSSQAPSDAATDAPSTHPADAGRDGAPTADAGSATDAAIDAAGGCSVTAHAGAARSTGFSGTNSAFDGLFDTVPCATPADCVPSCTAAGGTSASCSSGSLCLEDSCPDGGTSCLMCLPPTYWLDPQGALGQPGSGASGTPADDTQALDNGYNDTLEVTQFHVALPAGAVVRGIVFDVDKSADDDQAADESVRVLKGGAATGTDHKAAGTWPTTYTETPYGGPLDLWGATWTAADVQSNDFGIAITPQYLSQAGNDHADIDSVSVTVFYSGTPGCP